MENRAYALVTVKAVNEDQRVIEGYASTPTPDWGDDVMEPKGAEFSLPLPLLWQHRSDEPVGSVEFAEADSKGIRFRATIAKIEEPGPLRDLVDKAWQAVKAKLVRGVSIGFHTLDGERRKSGGIHATRWAWHELSLVTIPMNREATITTIKSIVAEQAASGHSAADTAPAASGDKPKHVVRRNTMAKKSIADQIAEWEETRRQKSAEQTAVFADAGEGETLDAAAQETFDAIEGEIEQIDGHIKRLKTLQKSQAETAKEIKSDTRDTGAERAPVTVKAPKSEPGLRMARYVRSMYLAKQANRDIMSVAQEEYGQRDPGVVDMIKAAVIASNTTTDAALIGNEGGWADFVEYLRPQTILGKFGMNGIPSLTRVPFRVPLITEASESTGYWVGEGKPKPVTKATWSRTEMTPLKVATIAVATMEQIRDSSPAAEGLIRNSLTAAVVKRIDQTFISTTAASAGVSPAGILNGLTATVSGGGDADAIRSDAGAVMSAFATANNPLNSGVWIMSQARALWLSLMMNPLGSREFGDLTVRGGTFMGLPVIISNHVATTAVVLVNAEDIYLADDGGVSVSMSTEASLQMMDNPTNDTVTATPVATDLVSLWQTNSVGFLAERTLNWMLRRTGAVAYVSGVAWGEPGA
jgi:HK97 family phage major capsid protein/HK97 family phage prohead protease